MDRIFAHLTEVVNQTDQEIGFEVENGYFQLRALPSGKKRHVKLWKVLRGCRKAGNPKWKIKFIMNREFSGLEINAAELLSHVRIVIKLERIGEEPYSPYLEATLEKPRIDLWFRLRYFGCMRDKYWSKRPYSRIRPSWGKNLRVVEDPLHPPLPPQVVVPETSIGSSCRPIVKLPSGEESDEREANVSSLPDETIISSLPPELHGEEQGLPKRERVIGRPNMGGSAENNERGLGGGLQNLLEQPEPNEYELRLQDMERTVRLLLLLLAFICVICVCTISICVICVCTISKLLASGLA